MAEHTEEEKEKKEEYPEMWFISDGMGIHLGNVSLNATGKFHAQISKDLRNVYFAELFTMARPLGSKAIEKEFSVIIPDVDKEAVLDAFTDAGFLATRAGDEGFEELTRELDKLQTVKGGESKKYKGAKKNS